MNVDSSQAAVSEPTICTVTGAARGVATASGLAPANSRQPAAAASSAGEGRAQAPNFIASTAFIDRITPAGSLSS